MSAGTTTPWRQCGQPTRRASPSQVVLAGSAQNWRLIDGNDNTDRAAVAAREPSPVTRRPCRSNNGLCFREEERMMTEMRGTDIPSTPSNRKPEACWAARRRALLGAPRARERDAVRVARHAARPAQSLVSSCSCRAELHHRAAPQPGGTDAAGERGGGLRW